MSEVIDGEPAFPVPVGEREFWDREENGSPNGMSLRDWFAGMALMGSMASDGPGYEFTGSAEDRGRYCYKCADGMLAARKEGA
jgi:hypothetical protein